MILLDTNVLIDCLDTAAINHDWANRQVIEAVTGEGGAVNAVIVAELCAGDREPDVVATELRKLGVQIFDLPTVAASLCGKAFRRYKLARMSSGGTSAPTMPLPDFFIGAHAELMGWKVSTRDPERFRKYFPLVRLLTP